MVPIQRSLVLTSFLLILLRASISLGPSSLAQAQVVPDTTLGVDTSNLQLQGNRITIDGGANRGQALFHSFDQFNVANGQQVFFSNPQGIETILGRVTGTTPSNLNGTLGVLGPADLFLLNPNGIVFGANTQLDLSGSFTVSTADSLQVDDITFSATAPAPVPLLSINVSPGIQFGANAPDRLIQNQAVLSLAPQQQLRFDGGTIQQTGQITIPGGTVDLRGSTIALAGEINTRTANNQVGLLKLSSPTDLTIAATAPLTNQAVSQALRDNAVVVESDRNLTLVGTLTSTSAAPLNLISGNNLSLLPNNSDGVVHLAGDAILQSGNDIVIENQLFVTNLSFFPASLNGGVPFTIDDQRSRSIILQSTGDIIIRDTPETSRFAPANQQPNMLFLDGNNRDQGGLSIQANSLTMQSNGFVKTIQGVPALGISSTIHIGQSGGDVTINVVEDLTLLGNSFFYVSAGESQDTGDIDITAGNSIRLTSDSNVLTDHYLSDGIGQTGNINIYAGDTILLEGNTISTASFSQVGDISLMAPHIVLDGSEKPVFVGAGTVFLSPNDAGNITINAIESLELIGNQPGPSSLSDLQQLGIDDVFAQASTTTSIQATALGSGESGQIAVDTKILNIRDGAVIANASGLQGTPSSTGDVVINASNIQLQGTATIANGALGAADGGHLEINSDLIRLTDGAGIAVSSALGTGDSGELIIRTDELEVLGGSVIAANSAGDGNGGLLDIEAQSILIEGTSIDGSFPSSLLTDVFSTSGGAGGPLNIRTNTLDVVNGGQIRSNTQGTGIPGDIDITADRVTISGISPNGLRSSIEAQSSGLVKAGNIQLAANHLNVSDGAALSTQSQQGSGGNINLTIDEVLLLRNRGEISATAGLLGTEGDGGNIIIDAGFVVGPTLEDSDITANAFRGAGGNISISTHALLGLAFRDKITDQSDITASSDFGFDGTVVIAQVVDEVESDPVKLPENLVQANDRLTAGCLLDEDARFVATGRGGIPANPGEQLNQTMVWVDPRSTSTPGTISSPHGSLLNTLPLTEAQAWQINHQGQLELIAMANNQVPYSQANCQNN